MAWTITFYVFVSRGMKQEEKEEGEDREEHEEAGEEEGESENKEQRQRKRVFSPGGEINLCHFL